MSDQKILFKDNKGNAMQLDGKLTIADLVKMGLSDIKLMPEGAPLPDGWWRSDKPPPHNSLAVKRVR